MIKIQEISKRFGDRQLFDRLSLSIAPGEKVLISAPSGSGKTTLIKMILGFEIPDSGTITVDGHTLSPKHLKEARSRIAYVSQDSDLEDGTVRQQLETIFSFKINKHLTGYEDQFKSLSADYGLENDILDTSVIKLSGGERQRVALIIALLLRRPILILDEITSGLDSYLKTATAQAVINLEETVLIISHDPVWQDFDTIRKVVL